MKQAYQAYRANIPSDSRKETAVVVSSRPNKYERYPNTRAPRITRDNGSTPPFYSVKIEDGETIINFRGEQYALSHYGEAEWAAKAGQKVPVKIENGHVFAFFDEAFDEAR